MEEELEELKKDYEEACKDVREYVKKIQHLEKENMLYKTIATLCCLVVGILFTYMYRILKDKRFCE